MASTLHLQARLEIVEQACDLEAATGAVAGAGTRGTAKLMLIQSSFTPNIVTQDYSNNSLAGDPWDEELTVAGYTGDYGGAGRKAVSTTLNPAWTRDDANTRIEFDHDNPADWTSLTAGETIGGVGLIVEDFVGTTGADDETLFVTYDDTNDVATNGGDVGYAVNAEALIQI